MKPWVSASVTFYLKGAGKRPGITRESWTFAKEKPVSLWVLMGMICKSLVEFYINGLDVEPEAIDDELGKFREEAATWRIVEHTVPAPGGAEGETNG